MCHAAFSDLTPTQVAVRADTVRRILAKPHTNSFNLIWNLLEPLTPEILAQVLTAHNITPETPE